MSGKPFLTQGGSFPRWVAGAVILAGTWSIGLAWGQTNALPTADSSPKASITYAKVDPPAKATGAVSADSKDPPVKAAGAVPSDSGIVQAGCSTCGGGLLGPPGGYIGGCSDGGCAGGCYPGRRPCDCCWEPTSCAGRAIRGLYECLCCPDPCYDSHWMPVADAAFFVDAPRPKTQMRLRYDSIWDWAFPDRAEYLWARVDRRAPGVAGGPLSSAGSAGPPRVPPSTARGPRGTLVPPTVDLEEFSVYMEGAADAFGFFVEVPYRRSDPDDPTFADFSGFADMNVGTKSLILDCELVQTSFQFKTYIPIGQATKGLGTSHVSLEPSLLWAVKLCPTMYLQAQTAYWIPIAGDQFFAGDIFHYHLSLNKVIWHCGKDIQLVATGEYNGWAVLDGALTGPTFIVGARGHYASAGPGLRLFICDKIDIGVGSAFAITSNNFAEQQVRGELRWRF